MSKAIDRGRRVFFWPDTIQEAVAKDVNSYVLNGGNIDRLVDKIHTLSYSGLRAKLELDKWKKV
jgi:hypothetical protein